jgi:hypothetical protein
MKKVLAGATYIVALVYFGGAFLIFTPYYNWQYAKAHGFADWLFFGEFTATFKALGWPYFALVPILEQANDDPRPALSEEEMPQLRERLSAELAVHCENEFTRKATWTATITVPADDFCTASQLGCTKV